MKKISRRSQLKGAGTALLMESCALCRLSDNDPALYGEKVTLQEHDLSVHYFCLLTSCGVYQRGEESEGVFGFLVDDIKQEIRRSARLTCISCKKKGACVGCSVKRCRRTVHFPCGRKEKFTCQFTGNFPSYCSDHSPTQSVGLDISLPQSCSICLDSIEPTLSFSVLKCPVCHTSWFHRDCVQHQAYSAGLYFFRCTLCNNKESFQAEMLRMGIYIPQRDASWELEANAYSELLEVYRQCDAPTCHCDSGRAHSAKRGWFEVIRCCLCGSRGTHRRCAGLKVDTKDWTCHDCTHNSDGQASLVGSTQEGQRMSLPTNCLVASTPTSISCKRPVIPVSSPEELLKSLSSQLSPVTEMVEVSGCQALAAGLALVRRTDFDPTRSLSVKFKAEQPALFPSCLNDGNIAMQYFLKLLTQQIQESEVFEGPKACKNLSLNSEALREDLYFDMGCLLALSVVHGGPPLGFFSPGLYQCLFNYPPNSPLTLAHMTPDTHFTYEVSKIAKACSLENVQEIMMANREFLELAGCSRSISSLEERDALVDDLISFMMITRMQLPLQRFKEGLKTLDVFHQVQLFPSMFFSIFCEASPVTAEMITESFKINFSEQEDRLSKETSVVTFWRHFLIECEAGRTSVSPQDVLFFATGANAVPAIGFSPVASVSFLHSASSSPHEVYEEEERDNAASKSWKGDGMFPLSQPGRNHLFLPVTSSYQGFKSVMEQAISHHVHLFAA